MKLFRLLKKISDNSNPSKCLKLFKFRNSTVSVVQLMMKSASLFYKAYFPLFLPSFFCLTTYTSQIIHPSEMRFTPSFFHCCLCKYHFHVPSFKCFIQAFITLTQSGAPKPDKTPIMVVRLCCCRRVLFFKIKVRSRSCWFYPIWHPCSNNSSNLVEFH